MRRFNHADRQRPQLDHLAFIDHAVLSGQRHGTAPMIFNRL
jgi:hypothetical protein